MREMKMQWFHARLNIGKIRMLRKMGCCRRCGYMGTLTHHWWESRLVEPILET